VQDAANEVSTYLSADFREHTPGQGFIINHSSFQDEVSTFKTSQL